MLPCSVTAIAGIFSFDRLIEQLVDAARAVEQRELGVQVKVDEFRHRYVPNPILNPASRSHSHSIVDGGFELMS